jgi:hypothetical protein
VRQILQAIHEALTQTVARVKKAFRKPPLLEGDINFIELEHPEFVFMRLPDEDGIPCLASETPFGEVYVCALPRLSEEDVKREEDIYRFFTPSMYICNTFRLNGVEDTYCSQPCLRPKLPRYEAHVGVARGGEIEWEGVMTEFGAGALSQIYEIKQIVKGGDYNKEALKNIIRAVVANVREFLTDFSKNYHEFCVSKREETDRYLSSLWESLVNTVGEETLYELGFKKTHFSCDVSFSDVALRCPGYAYGTGEFYRTFNYFRKYWRPEYDDREFYEKLFRKVEKLQSKLRRFVEQRYEYARIFEQNPEKFIDKINFHHIGDLLDRWCKESDLADFCEALEDYESFDEGLRTAIWETIYEHVSLKDLVEDGYLPEKTYKRKLWLEKTIKEMWKTQPIPGMEEEYEKKLEDYEYELETLNIEISDAYDDYADHLYGDVIGKYGWMLRNQCKSRGRKSLESEVACETLNTIEGFCREHPWICVVFAQEEWKESKSED